MLLPVPVVAHLAITLKRELFWGEANRRIDIAQTPPANAPVLTSTFSTTTTLTDVIDSVISTTITETFTDTVTPPTGIFSCKTFPSDLLSPQLGVLPCHSYSISPLKPI